MAKKCIGIDIGPDHIRAVQLSRTDHQFHIEKAYGTQTRRSTDSLPEILKALVSEHSFDQHADVAIAAPNNAVFFRDIQMDSDGLQKAQEHQVFSVEHDFPVQSNVIATQIYSHHPAPGNKHSVILAAVDRQSLQEKSRAFIKAKMRLRAVDTVISAIHATAAINHPEITEGTSIIVYVDNSHLTLAVTEHGNILIVRNVPILSSSNDSDDSANEQLVDILSREIQVTRRRLFGSHIEHDCKIYLASVCTHHDILETLLEEKLGSRTITIDPYAKVENFLQQKADFPVWLCEGLALRLLAPELTTGVNFLKAANSETRQKSNNRRDLITCATLIAAVIALLLIGLFLQLSHLETAYANTKREITKIFKTTLPEEKNIVNPPIQMEQHLELFRKNHKMLASFDRNSIGPLQILHILSENAPQSVSVNIDDMLLTESTARMTGTFGSFESLYEWQRILEKVPEFNLVDIQDAQKQPNTDLVNFTMLIYLKEQR